MKTKIIEVDTFKKIKVFDKKVVNEKLIRLLKRRLEISDLRKEKVQLKREIHKEIYNYSIKIEKIQSEIDYLTLEIIINNK
jgi:uncharacterized protein YdcH (DUF465 family)